MDIFVYSDEAGVLDKYHNQYYIFGGVIFLSTDQKDNCSRKYISAERKIRASEGLKKHEEVKASKIKPKSKNKLYQILRSEERFGAVIFQQALSDENFFSDKKTKQRYLDWVYKMSVKKKLEDLIRKGLINPDEVESISFLIDEHSTATNGRYELRESLEKELKIGVWNFEYMTYYKPIFPGIKSVNLQYCNSSKITLVRAADIIANHLFFFANKNSGIIPAEEGLSVFYHPKNK